MCAFAHMKSTDMCRFLLVSLSMNAMSAQSTIPHRRKVLRQMTSGLGMNGLYTVILEQIMRQGGDGEIGDGSPNVGLTV